MSQEEKADLEMAESLGGSQMRLDPNGPNDPSCGCFLDQLHTMSTQLMHIDL